MSVLVSDVINLVYLELGVISPQETISNAMQTDAFDRMLSLLGSLNAEGLTIPQQVSQAWQLTAATSAYTLGSGGTLATTGALRAQKVTAWRAYYSTVQSSGGRALSFAEYGAAVRTLSTDFSAKSADASRIEAELISQLGAIIAPFAALEAELVGKITMAMASFGGLEADVAAKVTQAMAPFFITPSFAFPSTATPAFNFPSIVVPAISWPSLSLSNSAVPLIIGADTAYPLINVRVFPTPSSTPAYLELDYWTPILDFASVGTAITLPPGWVRILTFLLAQDLFGTYGRPSMAQYIAGMAKDAKASLILQNSMGAPEPVPSAPQGQV